MPALHALLLTDVVDSTKLTEALGDAAMAELWTTHDRIARDLLPPWRGREIDKTDGMLLLFDDVRDAVGYALAYHRALAARELPFKARAGIHVGPVSLRPNPADDVARGAKPVEVDGLALPIAARVMSVALGAQTLLSADARLALGVATQRVVSHGHWRMHGVADPIELYEIGEVGDGSASPFRAPPDGDKVYRVMRQGDLWQPVREVRHSVPAERDSFVGRQEPLHLLAKKFEDGARLVSVLGMGGTGKTRLVTRFAWTVLGDYPGGVWFCDLSQARTVDGIHFAVAQGLDVPLGKTEPVVQLAHAIAGRGKCLVILDNFEQVTRFAEETLGRWLDRAPLAQFIVTTREVLGVVGEVRLALAPLEPVEAVQLFQRRALAAHPSYRPAADDIAAVEQLVKVLDGLPLAIELAAARVRVMGPRVLLQRMSERFKVLWSSAGRQDRQATLRAAFDWSWELLTEPEKAGLAQLSVFRGGFTLAAAEVVLDFTGLANSPWTVDAVQWLVEKSFVRSISTDRFDLLESVREYAAEHLRTPGRFAGSGVESHAAMQRRHWQHFATFDENTAPAHRCVELDNLVCACVNATAAGDSTGATGALVASWYALRLTGPFRLGSRLADGVAALASLSASELALVHWVSASALDLQGLVKDALAHIEPGLEAATLAGDSVASARLLHTRGSLQTIEGDLPGAMSSLEESSRLAVALQDANLHATALNALGRLMDFQSRLVEARRYYETALDIVEKSGHRRLEGGLVGNLGGLHHDLGELEAARHHYERSLMLAREVGNRLWEGNALCNLGLLCHDQGDVSTSLIHLELALVTANEIGHVRLKAAVLCNLGISLTSDGRYQEAIAKLELAIEAASSSADRRSEGQYRGALAKAQALSDQIAAARISLGLAEQLLSTMSDRLSYAVLLCDRAEVEALDGNMDAARIAAQEAKRIVRELDAGPQSTLARRLGSLSHVLSPCAQ